MYHDPSQELLDIVDENDTVTGVETRGKIHRMGLMHRATHILVFNDSGDLFLQKRSLQKDNNPGLWDSAAAGHVDAGEDYQHCALRELKEELGIDLKTVLEPLFKLPPTAMTGMEHCQVFRCAHNGPFILQAEEIDDGKWVTANEMDRLSATADSGTTEVLRLIWSKLRDTEITESL